jgi:hypothetical protein
MPTVSLSNKFLKLSEKSGKSITESDEIVFGAKVGLVVKLFGCWHTNISRPFTNGKVSYRSCLQCGARKKFNPETLETHGSFYFPPSIDKGYREIKSN